MVDPHPAKKLGSGTARQYMLVALAFGVSAFVLLVLAAAIVALLRYAGYELSENGETWLRCIVLGLLIGWGPRYLMRRVGIKV